MLCISSFILTLNVNPIVTQLLNQKRLFLLQLFFGNKKNVYNILEEIGI